MIPAILLIGFFIALIDWNTGKHLSRTPTTQLIFGIIGIVAIIVIIFK